MTKLAFRQDMKVTLEDHMGSDLKIARAARASTAKDDLDLPYEGRVRSLMRQNHSCYDEVTEVLTGAGWKFWPDVTDEDTFASLDLESEEITFDKPSRVIASQYDGEMVQVKALSVDALVTPNHRMVHSIRLNAQSDWSDYRLAKMEDIEGHTFRLRLGGGSVSRKGIGLTDSEALLLGFATADAHVESAPVFHLHKQRKINFLFGLGFDTSSNNDHYRVKGLSSGVKEMLHDTYADNRHRRVPPRLMREGSAHELSLFLEGYLEGDGSVSSTGKVTFSTVSKQLMDDLQAIGVMSGGAVIEVTPADNRSHNAYPTKNDLLYRGTVYRDRNARPRIGWTHASRSKEIQRIEFSGMVYCATVPKGTLYVRRNGKAMWSGNSPFEHNVVTVRVEVPKRVAWEWERHRTQAFSELSTRYAVMLPEFYLPPRERPILHVGKPMDYRRELASGAVHMAVNNRRRRHAKYAWKAYEEDRDVGVALEVAAEHLPPYIYTRFWATANLHNWLKFLDLRLEEHALWEIQEAADQVLDILMELYPVAVGAWNEKRMTGEIA